MTGDSAKTLYSVQYLRAIAAISVALYHTTNVVAYLMGSDHTSRFVLSSGVDLFFLISGFIIYKTATSGKNYRPIEFAWNRFTRVVPLYWVFTLLSVPILIYSHDKANFSLQNLLKSVLFIPYEHWPVLAVGWTLNYEVFFYLTVFVSLVWFRSRLATSVTLILLLSFVASNLMPPSDLTRFYSKPIIFEFLMGLLIARFYSGHVFGDRRSFAGFLMIALGVIGFVIASELGDEIWSNWQPALLGIPSGLLLTGFIALEVDGYRFKTTFIRLLGDASYSIYLTHLFVIAVIAALGKLTIWPKTSVGMTLLTALSMILIVAVGLAAHWFVEKPLLIAARRLYSGRRPMPVAAEF